jgi:hypothetical protein
VAEFGAYLLDGAVIEGRREMGCAINGRRLHSRTTIEDAANGIS